MNYRDLGYNNLLSKQSPAFNIDEGINEGNVDSIIGDGSVGFSQTQMGVLHTNQDMQSKNFVTGSSGWRIKGNGTAEFQTVIAGDYIKIFVQDAIPTSEHINDLWIDSNDNNKRYRSASVGADQITAGEWELIANPTEWDDVLDGATTKPTNNATVGATFGSNISGGGSAANQISNTGYIDNLNANTINVGTLTGFTIQTNAVTYPYVKMTSTGVTVSGESSFNVITSAGAACGIIKGYYSAGEGNNIIAMESAAGMVVIDGEQGVLIGSSSGIIGIVGAVITTSTLTVGGDIRPTSDGSHDLGNSSYGWGRAYIGTGGGYLYESGGKIAASAGFAGVGEVNTMSSSGGTYSWIKTKAGVNLPIRGFSIGSGLSVTDNTTYWTLNHATGSGHNHIPINGSSYQMLRYSSAGVAQWSSDTYANYFRDNGSTTKYMHYDGSSWTFNDDIYSNATITAASWLYGSGLNLSSGVGNAYFGGLYLNVAAINPTYHGSIRCYNSGGTNQFRGVPSSGWTGSFDMTAV